MTDGRERRTDLDIARGVAVFLIVLFHMLQYFQRAGFTQISPTLTYFGLMVLGAMHIPVFMFIAGYVLALSGRRVQTWPDYRRFIKGTEQVRYPKNGCWNRQGAENAKINTKIDNTRVSAKG